MYTCSFSSLWRVYGAIGITVTVYNERYDGSETCPSLHCLWFDQCAEISITHPDKPTSIVIAHAEFDQGCMLHIHQLLPMPADYHCLLRCQHVIYPLRDDQTMLP